MKFQLSTILGVAVAVLTALEHALPDQPWIGMLGAAATAVAMDEKDLSSLGISPPKN